MFSSAHPTGRFVVPEVTLANLDAVDARLRALVRGDGESEKKLDDPQATTTVATAEGEVEEAVGHRGKLFLYVCTHGSRDCRCGDCGRDVARALQREIDRRGLSEDVFLGELAHVGGHKCVAICLLLIARQGHDDGRPFFFLLQICSEHPGVSVGRLVRRRL